MIQEKPVEVVMDQLNPFTVPKHPKLEPESIQNKRNVIGIVRNLARLKAGCTEFFELHDAAQDRYNAEVASYLQTMARNVQSVVMVLPKSSLKKDPKNKDLVVLKSKLLKNRLVSLQYRINPGSPLAQQPSVFALGSGFFIGENMVATSARVILGRRFDLSELRFVLGVNLEGTSDFTSGIRVSKSRVFRPALKKGEKRPPFFQVSGMNSDWALLPVKPAFRGIAAAPHPFVQCASDFIPKPGLPVYGIGHSLNLPVKVSFEGEITHANPDKPYFECSLTALGGHPGSPVFNAETHELVGIYIRGSQSLYLPKGEAKYLLVNTDKTPVKGQDCQSLQPVLAGLKKLTNYKSPLL